ncbi:oxidoreductase, short chain dehydrogenase/reductase family protein [Necator americanus]|uniref:Oxidoreductase, short chain dehydrogenase/reductase family protein n=1 Tax=Necator americanus TaxID=51031 RepID=W2SW59_NECAM|nr:oxidoreductase, short chain dehydrogenase/reductase family protein [Necator americanus]ETN73989.1 oxidoreductase, short chain dehydrogenase/reductase family protein [Necator americanus]
MSRFIGKVVIVTAMNQSATKHSIIDAGGKEDDVNVVVADVTDAVGREQIVSSTVQKWGKIDVLSVQERNTSSAIQMVQLTRPHLVKAKGEVVNISSIAGQPKGTPKFMYYAMAKAALDQMTRALAIELIAEGVRVNSVSPGAVLTKFCQNAGMSDADTAKVFYEKFASSEHSLPIREIGQPEDIANVIAFLADRHASRYIIGQTIIADGGSMLVIAANATSSAGQK